MDPIQDFGPMGVLGVTRDGDLTMRRNKVYGLNGKPVEFPDGIRPFGDVTVNVRAYGAKGDGVTDDGPAFSAAWADLKAFVAANTTLPATLFIPAGTYRIATSINWTGGATTLLAWNIHIEGSGAVLLGETTGKAVIDMTGVRGIHMRGLAVVGSSSKVPACGLLVGARASDTCGNGQFNNLIFRGNYSKACVGNIAIETTTWRDCYFMNDASLSTAYAYAADGGMNLGFTSDYSTLRAPGSVNSLTNNSFSGCRFSKLTAGYCVYLERTINWHFHRDNYFLAYDNAAFYINQTVGTTNRDLKIEGLFETTGLKFVALIVCTDGQVSNLRRLYVDAGLFFAQTAMIGVKRVSDLADMTSGACNISGAELHSNGSTVGPNTVPLFSGAKISLTGDIHCDYGAMINLGTLMDFHGEVFTDDLSAGTAPNAASSALVFERNNNRIKVYGPQAFPGGAQGGGSAVQQAALTGSTAETVLGTVTIPAGAMGPNGYIRARAVFSGVTNNANNKSIRFRLGGLAGTLFSSASDTTDVASIHTCEIHNRNSQAAQVGWGEGNRGTDSLQQFTAPIAGTIDTTQAQAMVVTAQLANAADSITLECFIVEVVYGA